MARGTVDSFDSREGYGRIILDQTSDSFFVHESSLCDPAHLPLKKGQTVYFEIHEGAHGRQAIDVRPVTLKDNGAPSKC